jgi:hypothetical protein
MEKYWSVGMAQLWKFRLIVGFFSLTVVSQSIAAFDPIRKVISIDTKAGIIGLVAKPGEPVYYYQLTKKTRYLVSGERLGVWDPASHVFGHTWKYADLSSIKLGETVTVEYHISSGRRIADRIAIYPK